MYNVVNLIGRLGQDPEVKNLKGGKTVVNVSMVTSDSYKTKDGEQREDSEWHSLVSWGKSAEYIGNNFAKGDLVFVSGKLTYNEYEDKNGNKQKRANINVSTIKRLSSKQ